MNLPIALKASMAKTTSCHMITATMIARTAQEVASVPKSITGTWLVTPEREVKMIVQNFQLSVQLNTCENRILQLFDSLLGTVSCIRYSGFFFLIRYTVYTDRHCIL